jgi:hypothetical protein
MGSVWGSTFFGMFVAFCRVIRVKIVTQIGSWPVAQILNTKNSAAEGEVVKRNSKVVQGQV